MDVYLRLGPRDNEIERRTFPAEWSRLPGSEQLTGDELDRLVEGGAARTGVTHRGVLVPDRHTAEEDEPLRGGEELSDCLAYLRPRHLWATVQPFGAEQQHDGLQIHAYVGPLGPAHVAVDVAEQGGGRAETLPVADGRPLARFPVLARNAECAVALLAEGGSALRVRGLQRGRVHLVLPLVPGVAVGNALDGVRLELGQRRAGQHVGVPRLDVRSGRRPTCGGQHALKHFPRHRLVFESAHRPSACDGLIYVHDNRLPTAGHPFRSNACGRLVRPNPTSGQYSQWPGTQRKTSPSTATWQTDGNDR